MINDPRPIYPGDRVVVFDSTLYRDDRTTPLEMTMRDAVVIRRYGKIKKKIGGLLLGPYPDLVDVKFIHDGRESKGHFTTGVRWYPSVSRKGLR